ncbi:MAG: hypothetical protein JWM45_4058 [Pseudonocardiales bacterium]|jgi:hypothetical protein|nr:hypothetical protein [Pseudonocardiales bacterium]
MINAESTAVSGPANGARLWVEGYAWSRVDPDSARAGFARVTVEKVRILSHGRG